MPTFIMFPDQRSSCDLRGMHAWIGTCASLPLCVCLQYVKEAGAEAKTRGGGKQKEAQMRFASQQFKQERTSCWQMAESGCMWAKKKKRKTFVGDHGPFDEELKSSYHL